MRKKIFFIDEGGSNPPVVVIHGSGLDAVPAAYTRYLERSFLEAFRLQGTPLQIQYKMGQNPFANKGK